MINWQTDIYRPTVSTDLLGFDNYQIYDLIFTNSTQAISYYIYTPAIEQKLYKNASIRYITSANLPNPLGITNNADPNNPLANAIFLSYGSQGNYGWIVMENYQEITSKTPESFVFDRTESRRIPPEIYAVQRYTPYGAANTDLMYTLLDEYKVLTDSLKINWKQLIISQDIIYSGIAQVSGLFEVEYWSNNYLEKHPLINNTLDYRKIKVRLVKGNLFSFKLLNPIAHTLRVPLELQAATAVGQPLLIDILSGNRIYANSLSVATSPPTPPPSGFIFKKYKKDFYNPDAIFNPGTGVASGFYPSIEWYPPTNPEIKSYQVSNYTWNDYRVLRATNRVAASTWGVDADVGDYPLISAAQMAEWHFLPQPSQFEQYGNIPMDSIRTIQILALLEKISNAIDAETYGEDPNQPGLKRVANLGWGIMKLLEVMGIRRQPDGKYLTTTESKKYERTRENSPTWKQGDYGNGEWGKFGLAFKYLPTTYKDGQRQDHQYDIVHDYPQLLAAVLDQLDHSLNIQHGSEVRIPAGQDIQSYPNQGAATIDTAARIIQMERAIEQLLTMQVETSNSVREIFAGIGIPITTKIAKAEIGGQIVDIHYPAYQQSKPSIIETIGSLKSNVGLILGALMPQKSPKDNPLNPWNWKKK
jgi:hypothetical protein